VQAERLALRKVSNLSSKISPIIPPCEQNSTSFVENFFLKISQLERVLDVIIL